MEEILIEIGPTGDVKIEANGFTGSDCKALTKALEEAIGTPAEVTLKPEYHRQKAKARPIGR